ncbi:MAG: IS4 family transposase [Lentisphaeria bacterium]|nr:IS4 family transposase [Lentisphaeria bacterium]
MEVQHQIKRRLSAPDSLAFVREVLAEGDIAHRTALADRVCGEFGFFDDRGLPQHGSCLAALRALEQAGEFELPPALTSPGPGSPRRLDGPVPAPVDVPPTVDAVVDLCLVPVDGEERMRIWNELMLREHPRGAGPLVGRQLRYLVGSAHGWLGALGFSAAARRLEDRDRWIGWDDDARARHLHRVVGMSRLLIRPQVHCGNLASRVLGLSVRRMADDFERRYGFAPLLAETFVDSESFTGSCYRAANWERIGRTKGRGRQDRERSSDETVKDIYVYPLRPDFRTVLGLRPGSGLGPLELTEGLEAENWAAQEFGGAPLGDRRLADRLVQCARRCGEQPGRAFTGAGKGDWAEVKGYYRLIEKPDESGVTPANILLPHRRQSVRRIRDRDTVLCIQDGTDLNYNGLAECEGLGVTGTNQTGAISRGLHLHTTFAVTDDGLPIGVLRAEFSAPQPRPKTAAGGAGSDAPAPIPPEEKKTFQWIAGLRDCAEVAREAPGTRIICVMDREADFAELFAEHRRHPNVELLVRAKHNRCTTEDLKLFDSVRQEPVCERYRVHVKRQSARPKCSGRKARKARDERIAEVELRYREVQIRPPAGDPDQTPISVRVVHVFEDSPPEGAEPLEWFLITTGKVNGPDDVKTCLRRYCLRWRIEDWHRVLKSGCCIEDLGHRTAERLERAIAMHLVVAWRIMLMTLLGRETPDLPAELLFSDVEIEVLKAYAARQRLPAPETLGLIVRLVARLGGHLGRKNDPPPGHQIMWQGYTQLHFMSLGYELRNPSPCPATECG